MTPPFRRALRECERWGVVVQFEERPSPTHRAPFSRGGISSSGEIIWYANEVCPRQAAAFTHELSHVIVWRLTGLNPEEQQETHMLALDYTSARLCKAAWLLWMSDYNFAFDGIDVPWPSAPIKERRRALAESRTWCEKRGLLLNGAPTYAPKFAVGIT